MKKMLLIGALAASVLLPAEEIVFNKPEMFKGAQGVEVKNELITCVFAYGGDRTSVEYIPVDPAKKYTLSCEARLKPGTPAGFFWIGVAEYTADKKQLNCCKLFTDSQVPLTQLVKAVKKGDKVIFVKDASKWADKYSHAAFDAKADCSDLPNFNECTVKSRKQSGAMWELTLAQPVPADYPAGTGIREHRDHASFSYIATVSPKCTEWQKYSRTLNGIAKVKDIRKLKDDFRTGAKFMRIVICHAKNQAGLEIKNLKLVIE